MVYKKLRVFDRKVNLLTILSFFHLGFTVFDMINSVGTPELEVLTCLFI